MKFKSNIAKTGNESIGNSQNLLGFSSDSSIRAVYSSLIGQDENDVIFSDVMNHPLIHSILVINSDSLAEVITNKQIAIKLIKLPSGSYT